MKKINIATMHDALSKQIKNQIEGKTTLQMQFTDTSPESLSLYDQVDGYFIQPLFMRPHKISKQQYDEILELYNSKNFLPYDDFFEKYYNIKKDNKK